MAESIAHLASPAIGIMDSGLGGLTVLNAVYKSLPQARYLYLSDHAYFPYGNKKEEEVIQRVLALASQLIENYHLDLFIVACNTASTITLPFLRQRATVPIIGVVPAIKPAAALSTSKVIGLLATEGTVRRQYTDDLIREFASDCQVVKLGSNRLVAIAEEKLNEKAVDANELKAILKPFIHNKLLDTIVLACTHFPHLQQELAAVIPRHITWVDSGQAIAKRAESLVNHFSSTKSVVFRQNTALFTDETILKGQKPSLWKKRFGISSFAYFDSL